MQQTNAVCVPCFWWEARQVWRLLSKPWGRWSMLWDLVVTCTLMSSWKYLALVHSLQHITWITAFFSTSQNTLHNEVLLIRLLLEQHQYPLVFTMTPTITCSLFHKKFHTYYQSWFSKRFLFIKYLHMQNIISCLQIQGGKKGKRKQAERQSVMFRVVNLNLEAPGWWVSGHALGGLFQLH